MMTIWFNDLLNESDTPSDRILGFCRSPKNVAEIAEMLGIKDKEWVRKKYVLPLLQEGRLRMTIPDKTNSQH